MYAAVRTKRGRPLSCCVIFMVRPRDGGWRWTPVCRYCVVRLIHQLLEELLWQPRSKQRSCAAIKCWDDGPRIRLSSRRDSSRATDEHGVVHPVTVFLQDWALVFMDRRARPNWFRYRAKVQGQNPVDEFIPPMLILRIFVRASGRTIAHRPDAHANSSPERSAVSENVPPCHEESRSCPFQ